jgi:magnesium-transporting ATPase (P-type)
LGIPLLRALAAPKAERRKSAGPKPGAVVAVKGAVEAVLDLCHQSAPSSASISAHAEAIASTGVRVLAVPVGPVRIGADAMPEDPHDLACTFFENCRI